MLDGCKSGLFLTLLHTLPYLVVPMLSVTLTLLREFLGPALGGILVYFVGYQWMTTVSMQHLKGTIVCRY